MALAAPGTAPLDGSGSSGGFDFGGGSFRLPSGVDERVRALVEGVQEECRGWTGTKRFRRLRLIFDQLEGEDAALAERYHPKWAGLTVEQQARVDAARRHVNLAEPALDRLVNSIHAGRITRKAKDERVRRLLAKPAHQGAMGRLCEDAFAAGTGFLVPLVKRAGDRYRVTYWHPDPLWTVLVVDAADVSSVLGIVEMVRDATGTRTVGLRFVGREIEGTVRLGTETNAAASVEFVEHGLPYVPVVVSHGRQRRKKYGKSLIAAAADGSIRVTNNATNLELLRDRQTQALLLIFGQLMNGAEETKESLQKFFQFEDKESGDARYITPESRIADVVEVSKRNYADTAVSSGLPVDTFLPEVITGSDASATAARVRAFPLMQRMTRLNVEWVQTEAACAAVIGGQVLPEEAVAVAGDLEFLAEELGIEVTIQPSLPEAEAETLSNWQQKTEKFFTPVEQAVEYYSGELSEERKAELAELWRKQHGPAETAKTTAAAWKREIVKALFGDATTGDVLANMTNLRTLLDEVGIAREEGYVEPWLPVVAATGPLVSGEVVTDGEGDIVGGDVDPASPDGYAGTSPAKDEGTEGTRLRDGDATPGQADEGGEEKTDQENGDGAVGGV